MATELLTFGLSLLAWAAVLFRLPSILRAPSDAGRRAYWLTLLFLALALTVLLPPIYLWLGRLLGVPNVARLLGNGLVLIASWTVQTYLLYLTGPPGPARRRVRWTGWLLLGTLGLMGVFFALAPLDEDAVDFVQRFGDAPYVLEYRMVFLAYLGVALVHVARLSWRYAGVTDRPSMATGLRLVAGGATIGLGYVATELIWVGSRRMDIADALPAPELVTKLFMAVAIALIVVGSTMPAWGPRLGIPALCGWIGRYRAYRRLYPLWRALAEAAPEITLETPASPIADALTVRDLRFRLYRRVIEIRDGRLALRPYLHPAVAADARARCRQAHISGADASVIIDAACLAGAVQAKWRNEPGGTTAPRVKVVGGADLSSEVAALEQVARCYQRSPIVRAVVSRVPLPKHPAAPTLPAARPGS